MEKRRSRGNVVCGAPFPGGGRTLFLGAVGRSTERPPATGAAGSEPMLRRSVRRFTAVSLATCVLGFAWSAAAHIRLDSPTPRSMGSEVGPCGDAGTVRGTPTVLEGGQEITVTWTEVIDHPSHYRIALLLDGEAFPEPTSQSDICDPDVDAWCIADGLADESGSMTSYSHTFTLPNVDCDNCTLQVVQNTFVRYFQCADITIVAQPDDPDTGAGGTGGSAVGGSTGGAPDDNGVGGGGGLGPGPDPATGGSGEPSDLEDGSGAPDAGTSEESAGCTLGGHPVSGASWMLFLPVLWTWRRGSTRATPRG